jgi:hypothetical protein
VLRAADIATQGTASITVVTASNGVPGGGTSNTVTLTIGPPNTQPVVTSISPTSATAGGPLFTLTVNGSGFVQGSQVTFNLNNVSTTFVNSIQLTASIPAHAIAIAGNPYVIVTNPDGYTSAFVTFTVTPATDFNVSAPSPSQAITAGQIANYNLSLTAMNGTLGETVSFSASGLPPDASGSFMPPRVLARSAGTTVMLSVTTTPHSSSSFVKFPHSMRPHAPLMYVFVFAFVMMCFSLWFLRGSSRPLFPRLLIVALIAFAFGVAACGSGGGSSTAQLNPATGTPAGTYTITVTATSGAVSQASTVTLIVK